MSRCNFCTMRHFQARASKALGTVVTQKNPLFPSFPEGIDVFIKYPGVKEPVWCAWFAKLPDHCEC